MNPSPDVLFRDVPNLTSTTEKIGTQAFAHGGFSDIWRGVERVEGTERDVVIKVLRFATRDDLGIDRIKKRISREVIAWRSLNHINILPFYGLCWLSGDDQRNLPSLVFPYCEAGTCIDYLEKHPDANRTSIVQQVADALNYLHTLDPPVIHGDIKACNILMQTDGMALLADFGLSRVMMEGPTGFTTSSILGSCAWMAPELFGDGETDTLIPVSKESDVWAFGCLCVEVLWNRVPWENMSNARIIRAVALERRQPTLPAGVESTALGRIVQRCWAYKAEDRPGMTQLVLALVSNDPALLNKPSSPSVNRLADFVRKMGFFSGVGTVLPGSEGLQSCPEIPGEAREPATLRSPMSPPSSEISGDKSNPRTSSERSRASGDFVEAPPATTPPTALTVAEKSNSNMLFANFNQDFSCISVGTKKGYSITNCDPFGRVYIHNNGAQGIVEMLFCTSLIALVGAADQPSSSPRKLRIINTKRQSMICELLFPSSILAVKLNRKTLVVVLEVEIYIYDISNMRLMHVIETSPNPNAICALSPSSDPSYLVYPSPTPPPTASSSSPSAPASFSAQSSTQSTSGDVLIFDTRLSEVSKIVRAHKAPLAHVALNSTGTLLATASEKGTVIRVFSVPAAERLYEFRRGVRGARIHCITFNAASTLLAVSSATDTVYIFKLKGSGGSEAERKRRPSSPGGSVDSQEGGYEAYMDGKKKNINGFGLTRGIAGTIGGYLPGGLSGMLESLNYFASLKLPTSATRCIVAISSNEPNVMVISSEGFFYSYNIDLENGGACVLSKQYNLLDSDDVSSAEEA